MESWRTKGLNNLLCGGTIDQPFIDGACKLLGILEFASIGNKSCMFLILITYSVLISAHLCSLLTIEWTEVSGLVIPHSRTIILHLLIPCPDHLIMGNGFKLTFFNKFLESYMILLYADLSFKLTNFSKESLATRILMIADWGLMTMTVMSVMQR